MKEKIQELQTQAEQELTAATTTAQVEEIKVRFLGKKGPIQSLMKELRNVPQEERPIVGQQINSLKEEVAQKIEARFQPLQEQEEALKLKTEDIDVTLPGKRRFPGRKHVIKQEMDRMIDLFIEMGFSVQYGPDIESDYYNFEALNIDEDHPARSMQDTFYLDENFLLRTQTTNIQSRVLEKHNPPLRVVAPGTVYRNEEVTARSHVFFHQVDGFYVDKNVTFSDLLGTMDQFFKRLFKAETEVRYRPSYFPFVEPGVEIDVSCLGCEGSGCHLCKNSGWLEVAGAGMIHPEVLTNAGIDPEEYSGYAWGLGVERLVLLMRGVNDIRLFADNDMRLLQQFSAN